MSIDDTARLSAFVRRLRRIEAHPLIADNGGELVRTLQKTQFKITVFPETQETFVRFDLPDEVQFESLAARLRPMTVKADALHHSKVMDSLEALTSNATDPQVQKLNSQVRRAWEDATKRDRNRGSATRAYMMSIGTIDGNLNEHATDLDLAYAWLYEDSVHGDLPSYDEFSARDRYQAATYVFGGIACVALDTLNYIRSLIDNNCLHLPAEALDTPVVVSETSWKQKVQAYVGPVQNADDLANAGLGPIRSNMHQAYEVFKPNS